MDLHRIPVLLAICLLCCASFCGCKSPLYQSNSDDQGNTSATMKEWQNKSYQRDGSVLKTGSDGRARNIEDRLGVNRDSGLFD